ncbi:protein of unknown function [Acidithiobacillus ferrivorans]|uniref:Uncharacterized protein n=1 Tax=Acidithiobacillus ferrivorans TaxID=160808 RepID=A0A060UVL4_9PROT|nr:hypothetical protein [Acidithiobacillus ferrivorans]CDQ10589.1 hypothetical protein AFERRI_400370 [Acidithiobacillus ferrivorans]SMH64620.1 protein of unknown function [Acidithiobacillus ferrivorans]
MSTKIYNGFSVATDSAACLMDLVNGFRPYVQAEGQKMLNQFLRKTGTTEDLFRGWSAWMELRSETVDKGIRAPGVDTDFQLVFFPDGNRFLGIAFTEHPRWFRHWLRQPSVSEYRYWNNTDQPSGISRKEWGRRAETWDRVLGLDTPATRGFTITLHEIGGPFPQHRADRKRKGKGAS